MTQDRSPYSETDRIGNSLKGLRWSFEYVPESGQPEAEYIPEVTDPNAIAAFHELEEIIGSVLSNQTQPLLDTPLLYVQVSKDYQLGKSVTHVLGVAWEFAFSNEEAIEKIKFSMENSTAIKRLEPTARHIFWDACEPEGGEYIEGSLTCTGTVYDTIPAQYIYSHNDPPIPARVKNGHLLLDYELAEFPGILS